MWDRGRAQAALFFLIPVACNPLKAPIELHWEVQPLRRTSSRTTTTTSRASSRSSCTSSSSYSTISASSSSPSHSLSGRSASLREPPLSMIPLAQSLMFSSSHRLPRGLHRSPRLRSRLRNRQRGVQRLQALPTRSSRQLRPVQSPHSAFRLDPSLVHASSPTPSSAPPANPNPTIQVPKMAP